MIGERGFILAAGLGQRMRPLTDMRPKPLIEVGGKKLIDYAMDALRAAKVKHVVVNAHYFADQIDDWSQGVTDIAVKVSDERERLLDTGGGLRKALPLLGGDPFFVLNGDGFWIETETPALQRLKDAWNDAEMDCLLLLCRMENTRGFDGAGDFHVDETGRLSRRGAAKRADYAYIGGYLVHPRLFEGVVEERFSMNVLWDKAIARQRLFGLVHDGLWLHVGTPDAVQMAEEHLGQA